MNTILYFCIGQNHHVPEKDRAFIFEFESDERKKAGFFDCYDMFTEDKAHAIKEITFVYQVHHDTCSYELYKIIFDEHGNHMVYLEAEWGQEGYKAHLLHTAGSLNTDIYDF